MPRVPTTASGDFGAVIDHTDRWIVQFNGHGDNQPGHKADDLLLCQHEVPANFAEVTPVSG